MRQLWTEMGGTWTGTVREGPAPAGARLLHTHESPSLAEIVRDTNKFSNNIMARHLFLTLGAEDAGPPANSAEGRRRDQQLAGAQGNRRAGTGHGERLRPVAHRAHQRGAASPRLLQAAWRSPVMPEFIASHADRRAGRHHAPPAEGRRRHRPGAHQDRAALGRARDGRLRARPQRPAPGRGDDREPSERRARRSRRWTRCCAGSTNAKKRR